MRVAYTLMFVIRRGLYLSLGMLMLDPKLGGIQIILLLFLNLLSTYFRLMKQACSICNQIISPTVSWAHNNIPFK